MTPRPRGRERERVRRALSPAHFSAPVVRPFLYPASYGRTTRILFLSLSRSLARSLYLSLVPSRPLSLSPSLVRHNTGSYLDTLLVSCYGMSSWGRKFAVAVIEPPYRAQLSTANPGLRRYTFESDFPWMSGAVVTASVRRM